MNIARAALLLIALQCLPVFVWAQGTSQPHLEHHIKAVFLYKFPAYVEWPESTFATDDEPLAIGVMGAEQVAEELLEISKKKTPDGRPIEIRRVSPEDNLEKFHILFVGGQKNNQLPSLLSRTQSRPILTVTESSGALSAGSVINFLSVNRNIRFEISTISADSHGIKISSRLLGIAHHVELDR